MAFDIGSLAMQAAESVVQGAGYVIASVVRLAQSPPTPSAPVSGNPWGQVIEIAKLLAVAVPGYLLARREAKKEERSGQATRDESLVAGWQSMSMQAREQLSMAYADTAREREARHAAEKRVEELEKELAELRRSVRPQ